MPDGLVSRLRELDSCAVSDACDTLGISGAALGLAPLSGGGRTAGRVVPVRLVAATPGIPPARHLCSAAVEASGPGDVIVVANDGRETVAGWGGNLSLAAVGRGIAGVIVDGACRDLAEARQSGLALFARCAVPVTARGRIVEESWNTPVTVAGVAVSPGDLVIADADGVVFLPSEQAAEIMAAAELITMKERQMAADIRRGVPLSVVMGASYEQMLKAP